LKHGYSAIKQLVREIYGFETKIKGLPCSKPITQSTMTEPQSNSMIEDAEIGASASCVTNCSTEDEPVKEIDGADILNEPIVQRATELFEATKRTIQSKI